MNVFTDMEIHAKKKATKEVLSSLDEAVQETLFRDFGKIYSKVKFFYQNSAPEGIQREIQDYELWGPFLFLLLFASFISLASMQAVETVFTTVILFLVFGISMIIINFRLLGFKLQVLPGVSMVGYLIVPLVGASLFNCVFQFLPSFIKIAVVVFALTLSLKITWTVCLLLSNQQKNIMGFYPMCLFEICLSFFIFYT